MNLRGPGRAVVALVALVVLLGAGNWFAQRSVVAWDLTSEGSGTLSEETHRVLDELDRRVRITAFFGRDDVGRVEAATLLSRYRRANRRIEWRILDPRVYPGEAQRLGAIQRGQAVIEPLEDPGSAEVAQFTIEIDLTSALARIARGTDATLCFTSGHGERSPEERGPTELREAAELLRDNGYAIATIDLLVDPEVPDDCDALVLAAPREGPSEAAVEAVVEYLRAAGKAFVLADPAAEPDLSPLTENWGITFRHGIVVEADPGSRLSDDPTAPVVRRFDSSNPAVRGLAPVFFPASIGIVTEAPEDRPGLSVATVAVTSADAYLERGGDNLSFDPGEDEEGPIGVIAAADESEVRGATTERPEIRRTRILATGDVDFASDRHLGDGANARLLLQGVDWLTQPEPLVGAVPNFPEIRELELTDARSRYVLFLTAGAVPGMFLLAGGFVWVVRRGR